jgi:hypothetical protein
MPNNGFIHALMLGVSITVTVWPAEAQLKVSEIGDSALDLVSQAYQGNELDLRVSISEPGASTLMLDGVAGVGRHASDNIHRNSFWVDLDLKNETGATLSGVEFSLTATDGSQDPLDGLSFGALSEWRQAGVIEERQDFGATEENLWGFAAALIRADGSALALDQIEFPFGGSVSEPNYHAWRLTGARVPHGESLTVRFLVSQNGPDNNAFVQFDLISVPEPPLTGISLSGLALLFAVRRLRRRRVQGDS